MDRFKAVIFDFDGVIADTLEDSCTAWSQACSEHGVVFERNEFLLSEGKKSQEFITSVVARHGLPAELTSLIIARKNQIFSEIHAFSMFDGVAELVEELRARGIRTAVVSGGSRQRLLSGKSAIALSQHDTVVTGDDVTIGKPSPEPFLKAARNIGLPPQDCLVVENAPLGIQAAKAAGMTCVAVCSTLPPSALSCADIVVDSIQDVALLLRETEEAYQTETQP